MVTPRTHCHFVMQARALRVPEACVNHTPPSCLVAYPFTKTEYRVLYSLVLPDPWLTLEGPVTFLACALHKLFVRSCDLAHDGLHCSHVCAYAHRSLLLHLSLVFAFVSFCSQMEEHQNVQPSTGTTEWKSFLLYGQLTLCTTKNNKSYMMIRSPRLCSHWSPSQETNGTTSSGSVSGPQLPHSLISSHVPAGLQLPVPISLPCRRLHPVMPLRMCPRRRLFSLSPRYLLTWQCRRLSTVCTSHLWMLLCRHSPHSTVSQDVSTQMGARRASSFSLDAAVQTPIRSTVLHDTSTQLPLTEFVIGCIFSNDPFDRQGSSSAQGDIGSVSPPQPPDIATTCSLSSSSLDRDDHVRTLARVLLQPPPGLELYAPPPGLDVNAHLCASHGIPVKAAPLRPRLFSAISVTPPQPPVCTIHVGTHPVRSATTGKRSG